LDARVQSGLKAPPGVQLFNNLIVELNLHRTGSLPRGRCH
jgi:hypothetical protein